MLSNHLFHRIRQLRDEGKTKVAIARELGIDRKTVAKYMGTNSPPKYKQRDARTKPDPFAGFGEIVQSWCDKNSELSAREMFEFLRDQGYRGSERTVDRRVARIRGQRNKERFFEQVYTPGEQSQYDFKESVELPFVDGPRITHLHFGTLPCSDFCFVRAYPFKTYECFIDGIQNFFEEIGGMTGAIRIDNLSPCVSKVLKGNNRKYTKAFHRAIDHYGFKVLPCSPGKGNEKGDVERDIRTFSRRIKNLIQHQGVEFRDWEHLNEWLKDYMNSRRTDESQARLREEQSHLLPIPRREEGVLCRVEHAPSSGFGTVRVGKNAYSVPDSAIGVNCRTVQGPYEVKIYRADGTGILIATHPAKTEGNNSILLEHVLPSLVRKPGALVRWAHRDILFPTVAFRRFYSRLKKIDGLNAEREFLRSINLVQYVALSEIGIAMELVLESQSSNHGLFEELKTLLLGERRPADVIEISSRLGQRPIETTLSNYDDLIPKPLQPPPTTPGLEGGPPDDHDPNNDTDSRTSDQPIEAATLARNLKAVR